MHNQNFSATKVPNQAKSLGIVNIQSLEFLIKGAMSNEHLDKLLDKHDKKRKHLADVLAVSESAISHLFTGERKAPLSLEEGIKISKWLKEPLHVVLNMPEDLLNSIPPSLKQVVVVGILRNDCKVEYYNCSGDDMERVSVYLPAGISPDEVQLVRVEPGNNQEPYSLMEYLMMYADRHVDPDRVAHSPRKGYCIVTTDKGERVHAKIYPGTAPGKYMLQEASGRIIQDAHVITCQVMHSMIQQNIF